MLFGIGSGKLRHVFQHLSEVEVFQVQVPRPSEVDERLHNAVQTPNLTVDDVHVTARIGFLLRELILQQLQVKHDRVDWILYLMCHSPREPTAGGKSSRHLDLVTDSADWFSVANNQKRANL